MNKTAELSNQLQDAVNKIKAKKEEVANKKIHEKEQTYPYEQMAKLAPFFMLVIGKIRTGKSVFTSGFIQYALKHKTYERIFVISSTIHNGFWTKNGVKKKDQAEDISEEDLQNLMEFRKKQKNRKEWLFVMDDILTSDNARGKGLVKLISVLRHYNISIIVISQSVKKIDPLMRQNADFIATYRIIGDQNIRILFQETSMGEKINEWLCSYLENTKENSCLFINNNENDLKDRCRPFKVDMKYWDIKK